MAHVAGFRCGWAQLALSRFLDVVDPHPLARPELVPGPCLPTIKQMKDGGTQSWDKHQIKKTWDPTMVSQYVKKSNCMSTKPVVNDGGVR